ncbi:MAG: replication initiation protein [Methylococcales bacterium]
MSANLVVVKHNDLVRAAQNMTLIENRIILTCVGQINSKSKLSENDQFSIHVKELEQLMKVDHLDYDDLKSAAERIAERWIVFLEPSSRLKTIESRIRWVYRIAYLPKEGKVTLSFSPPVIPFLSELSENFTQYKIENVLNFRSTYSFRFYELFKSWMQSEKVLTIEWIKEYFLLGDSYTRTNNFQDRVIKPAIEEINKYSDLRVSYEPIKEGRKIVAFKFVFMCISEKKSKPKLFSKERIDGVLKADLEKYAKPGESYSQAATRIKAEQLILEKNGKPTTIDIVWR